MPRAVILLVLLASNVWATAYTFVPSSGNVNVGANWSPAVIPGTGDTASIATNQTAIVPNGYTWHVGTVTVATNGTTSGTLEVASGGIFEPIGNPDAVILSAASNYGPTGFATLKLDTGATLTFDQNNSATPQTVHPTTSYGWTQVLVGTAGDLCGATLASCPTQINCVNCGSAQPVLVGTNATYDNVYVNINGAGIKNCGSVSVGCVSNASTDTANGYLAGYGVFYLRGNIWDTTGGPQMGSVYNDFHKIILSDNKFANSLTTAIMGVGASGGSGAWTTACSVLRNLFDVPFGNISTNYKCQYTDTVFAQYWLSSSPVIGDYAGMSYLWIEQPVLGDKLSWGSGADHVIFTAADAPGSAGSSAHISDVNGGASASFSHIICKIFDISATEGHCFLNLVSSSQVLTFDHFISQIGGSGNSSGQLQTPNLPGSVANAVYKITHSSFVGEPIYGWAGTFGHTNNWPSNQVVTDYRSNLHTHSGAVNAYSFPLNTPVAYGSSANSPANLVLSSLVDYNVIYRGSAGAGFAAAFAAACTSGSLTQGTPENNCETVAAPDTHSITSQNPALVAPNRDVTTWAVTQGQASTVAGALAAFGAVSTSSFHALLADIFQHIEQGHAPTNMALYLKGHDGATAGVKEMSPQYWNDAR